MFVILMSVVAILVLSLGVAAMAAVTADQFYLQWGTSKRVADTMMPIKASTTIYQNSILGISGAVVRNLVAGDVFAGVALESAVGTAADAGASVLTRYDGVLRNRPVVGAAVTTVPGATVYAASNNWADITLSSTGNSAIGKVIRWTGVGAATACDIMLEAALERSI